MQTQTKDLLKITIISLVIVVVFFALVPNIEVGNFKETSEQSFATIVTDTKYSDIESNLINDYAPIFIPTKYNCAPKKNELPKISNISIYQSNNENINKDVSIVLLKKEKKDIKSLKNVVFMQNAFSGYGVNTYNSTTLKTSSILIITDMSNGNTILKKQLPVIDENYIVGICEFSLRIISGIAQTPILIKSSGKDNIDKDLLEMVHKESTSLKDGNYNAQIIP